MLLSRIRPLPNATFRLWKRPSSSSCIVPTVSYASLQNKEELSTTIGAAFGANGMGLLAVGGLPQLDTLRTALLPLAYEFGNLKKDIQEKYALEEAYYSFGWSRGKEKFQGRPDFSKGSYYNNPQYNTPVFDKNLIEEYPAFLHPNIWPNEVPAMEEAFMTLGQHMVEVGLLVAYQCDQYIQKQCHTYTNGLLYQLIQESLCCKARYEA